MLYIKTFDLIVEWVYTDKFELWFNWDAIGDEFSQQKVLKLIDLLVWADRFLLDEDDGLVEQALENIAFEIRNSITSLTPEAVTTAYTFANGRLRTLIAQYCVIHYLRWKKDPKKNIFLFEKNMRDSADFACDILEAVPDCLSEKEIIFGGKVVRGEVRLRCQEMLMQCKLNTVKF